MKDRISRTFALLIAGMASAATCQTRSMAAEPTLTAVSVTFDMPHCDDKDANTAVTMWIEAEDGSAVTTKDSPVAPSTYFGDPGSYGPFPLPVVQAVKKGAYPVSATKIHIRPVGSDTWCTNIQIDATFSDSSHLKSSACNLIKISEINPDFSFRNLQCLP